MARLSGWVPNNNNNPPEIFNQSFNIDENATVGTLVGTVVASDPDVGQELSFSIINGNSNDAFEIDSLNGELVVINSSALNFETMSIFYLTIQVTDNGPGFLTAQATVTVNLNDVNEPPIIEDQNFYINIDASILLGDINHNILSIGFIEASDPDVGQSISFSIIDGNGKGIWDLDENSGEIILANPYRLNKVANFSYPLSIQVSDNSAQQLSSTAIATTHANINNLPEYSVNTILSSSSTRKLSDSNPTLKIYPNPSSNTLLIELSNFSSGLIHVSILDINKNIITEKEILSSKTEIKEKMDVSQLKNGIYFICIRNSDHVLFDKIVKN
jgi:hypothetical protein